MQIQGIGLVSETVGCWGSAEGGRWAGVLSPCDLIGSLRLGAVDGQEKSAREGLRARAPRPQRA